MLDEPNRLETISSLAICLLGDPWGTTYFASTWVTGSAIYLKNLRIVLPTNYAGPDGHEPGSLLEIQKLSGTTTGLESHSDLSCEALQ